MAKTGKELGKSKPFEFRLKKYYYAVDLVGLFTPLTVGLVMFFFPQYFPWIIHPLINIWAFVGVVIFQTVDFFLYEEYRRKIFFNISRYIYIIFFAIFLYVSGGTQSTFIFVMMFPIVVSAVDLSPGMTRRVGVTVCLILAAFIFLEPEHLHDPVVISEHILHVSIFAFLAYFMYKLVRETLLQKYEKEETSRKFIQLIQVDQLKNDFLSVAQHQLRTPLSGIRWAFESLANDPGLSPENKDLVKDGVLRSNDAIGIINDMLKTVEAGKGSLTLSSEPTDIVVMVSEILEELTYIARHKEVGIRFKGPKSVIANVDAKKLKPSITNIIDNAMKYSPRGHVEVVLTDGQKDFTLEVKDDGIGISEDDMQFVFNRLYRGKNAIALEPDESGVGLYTAKRMIELHGGTVTLASQVGKGTTVTVTLPK